MILPQSQEIAFGEEEGAFDALILNDDLDSAVQQLTRVIDSKILLQLNSPKILTMNGAGGDVVVNGEVAEQEEEEGASGKKAKLEFSADSSRDSTPGAVER